MSPVTATMSGRARTPKSMALRSERMFSDGVPAWKSEMCRMLSPSSAAGSPATGTSSVRSRSHCDSNSPHALSPTAAAAAADEPARA